MDYLQAKLLHRTGYFFYNFLTFSSAPGLKKILFTGRMTVVTPNSKLRELTMVISRRKFAQTAGLTIIGAGLAGSAGKVFSQSLSAGFPISAESFADPLMGFDSATFQPYIGTIFQPVQNGILKPSLRLTEVFVHQSAKQPSDIKGESFSLLFRAVGRNTLPPETHTFEHASLGTFSLFIIPFERQPKLYEAVINHRLPG